MHGECNDLDVSTGWRCYGDTPTLKVRIGPVAFSVDAARIAVLIEELQGGDCGPGSQTRCTDHLGRSHAVCLTHDQLGSLTALLRARLDEKEREDAAREHRRIEQDFPSEGDGVEVIDELAEWVEVHGNVLEIGQYMPEIFRTPLDGIAPPENDDFDYSQFETPR